MPYAESSGKKPAMNEPIMTITLHVNQTAINFLSVPFFRKKLSKNNDVKGEIKDPIIVPTLKTMWALFGAE